MSSRGADRRARFRELHAGERLFVMPNPWDVGSARLLEHSGFEALATTSAGHAWSLGKLDQHVTRDELVAHVAELTAAVSVPLNVDSERCYPDDPGGVAATVDLLAEAGAAGFSIEDYDPEGRRIDDLEVAVERVAIAVEATRRLSEPMVLTARAENHIREVDDLDDTIARLSAYRDAGADVVYAPGLTDLAQISAVVSAVGIPVNVLALPAAPTLSELAGGGGAARLHWKPAGRRCLRSAGGGGEGAPDAGHVGLRREQRRARDTRAGPGLGRAQLVTQAAIRKTIAEMAAAATRIKFAPSKNMSQRDRDFGPVPEMVAATPSSRPQPTAPARAFEMN